MVDKPTITIEAFQPPPEIVAAVERVAGAARPGRRRHRIHDRRPRRRGRSSTTSTPCPTSSPTRWRCWAGTRTSTLVDYLLAPDRRPAQKAAAMRYGFWTPVFGGWLRNVPDEGMAATWDYTQPALPARRADRLRPDPDRRAEPQRHQGDRPAGAGRLVDRRGAGGGDRAAGADGRGAAELPPAGPVRQAGRQHRPASRRPAGAERRLLLVGGGGARATACSSTSTTTAMAAPREWLDVVDGLWREPKFTFEGQRYQLKDAICEPKPVRKPRDLRRRRVRGGQDHDRRASATPMSCTATRPR